MASSTFAPPQLMEKFLLLDQHRLISIIAGMIFTKKVKQAMDQEAKQLFIWFYTKG
jgi:hypothetical protein